MLGLHSVPAPFCSLANRRFVDEQHEGSHWHNLCLLSCNNWIIIVHVGSHIQENRIRKKEVQKLFWETNQICDKIQVTFQFFHSNM